MNHQRSMNHYRASKIEIVTSFPEQISGHLCEVESRTLLLIENAGCFGEGRRKSSLLSIDTTTDMASVIMVLSAPMLVPRSNDNKSFPATLTVHGFGSLMHNKHRDSNKYHHRFAELNLSIRLNQHTSNYFHVKCTLLNCFRFRFQVWNSVLVPFFCNFLLQIQ
ncbi:hypothetical protein RHMOL_Rhmol04G0029400 [Rhododendron molle]|uniref:Uncharacterized protein n=1 Tax=Rhododendron molle TaxID=49168 RepID=A0ACC0NXR4_RHOML|nr:hypothetical protein RHMOL_Rhmol04G0029400 [Rhododendron molle]